MGVMSANIYPKKLGESGARIAKSPPVMRRNPPIEAIRKPITFNRLNFSLKRNKAKIVITMGANRQTNNAGREGPITSIAVY